MFSQTAEYALRAVVCLATDPRQPQTARVISVVTHTPISYLAKVLQGLARAGLIRSQRGLHGGFTLARPPEEVSILEVIEAVEPLPRIRQCPLGLENHGPNLCPLHKRLDEAVAAVEDTFRATSVAELLGETEGSIPLCNENNSGRERVEVPE